MTDLFCLVADLPMQVVVEAVLNRPEALQIRPISVTWSVHIHRDSGCYHTGPELLRNSRADHSHGLLILDHAWDGPAASGALLAEQLRGRLAGAGLADWADVVVLEPELEAWLFTGSPHLPLCLGWRGQNPNMREWLEQQGLWPNDLAKPPDPKAAVERVLRKTRKPRSSSTYGKIAEQSSMRGCTDQAFQAFCRILRRWFPPVA